MREIRTSGSTRGQWAAAQPSLSVLLYWPIIIVESRTTRRKTKLVTDESRQSRSDVRIKHEGHS